MANEPRKPIEESEELVQETFDKPDDAEDWDKSRAPQHRPTQTPHSANRPTQTY
jgi:hypothetical protein